MKRIILRNVTIVLLLFIFAGSTWGCYYDSVEELYPISYGSCDTSITTYSGFVEPFINANCIGCHSTAVSSGGVTLEGHANAQAKALDGSLLGSLGHQAGYSAMPPSGIKIDNCTYTKINAWVTAGAPNN